MLPTGRILIPCIAILLQFTGCGKPSGFRGESDMVAAIESGGHAESHGGQASQLEQVSLVATAAEAIDTAETNNPSSDRKIIYNTTLGLVVSEYAEFEAALPRIVLQFGGFVASSNTRREYQDNQAGDWVVRVPSQHYAALLSGLSSLGFAESRSERAQDVTEEFVDLNARISNKKALESRILTLLEERSGKLNEVLETERELSRVREEIERMEGRLRYLREHTSLATITIHCRERREYQPAVSPTFTERIGQTWATSISTLRRTMESITIAVIAILPWVLLAAIPMWIGKSLILSCILKRRIAQTNRSQI